MKMPDAVIAAFAAHNAAETAVKKLAAAGMKMRNISVVGNECRTGEKAAVFYTIGDRTRFGGVRGMFWGRLWALFFGGLFITTPVEGHVIVLGYLAATMVAAVESAATAGGLSPLRAALYSIGVPKDCVIQYEADVIADGFLVMAHGTAEEIARAQVILHTATPSHLEVYASMEAAEPTSVHASE